MIDTRARRVSVGPRDVFLSACEFDILTTLAAHPGWVFSREQLSGEDGDRFVSPSAIGVHISHLRRKLADAGLGDVIETVRGVGFRMRTDAPLPDAPRVVPSGVVARDREVAQLVAALPDGAGRGRERAIFLVGEPGSGKTRCIDQVVAAAREQGVAVLRLGSRGGVVQVFEAWDGLSREPAEAGAARASTAASESRSNAGESLAASVARIAAERPALLLAEDLDQAGDETLAMLVQLFDSSELDNVLILGTFSVGAQPSAGLVQLLGRTVGAGGGRCVRLCPLAIDAVASVLAEVRGRPAPSALPELVRELTDGNPFFVEQLAWMLSEAGAWRLTSTEELASLPPTPELRGMVAWLVEPLSAEAREVLDAAAIAGDTLYVPVLEQVTDAGSTWLPDLIDELVQAGIVLDTHTRPPRFRVPIVRAVLCQAMPPAARMRLHGLVGDAFSAIATGRPGEYAACARHFRAAAPVGWAGKAVEYALLAAEQAVRHGARDAAERELRASLGVLRGVTLAAEERAEAIARLEQALREVQAAEGGDARLF